MAVRRTIEDVVPPEQKSIRKIGIEKKPAIRRAPPRRSTINSIEEFAENNRISYSKNKDSDSEETAPKERRYIVPDHLLKDPKTRSPRRRSFFTWVLSICAVLAIIFAGLSLVFSRATVLITPRMQTIDTTNINLTAKKDALSTELDYELVSFSATATTSIPGKLSVGVETRAKGIVTIYNTHSATPQTLVAGTRVQDTKGRVYRIDYQVSVPGYKMSAGKKVPGSVDVRVTAQASGPEFNMTLSDLTGDFKLPGYVGSPKYSGFYARLKTAITGGSSGRKVTVDESDINDIEAELKESILASLNEKIPSSVPNDFVLLDGMSRTTFAPRSEAPDPIKSELNISVTGTFTGALIRKDDLTKSLSEKYAQQFRNIPYTIPTLGDLKAQISEYQNFNLEKASSLTFKIFGDATIQGSVNIKELQNKLAGIRLKESGKVMAEFGGIASADIVLQPLWKRFILPSFPKNPEKIKVEIITTADKK